jgi:hypothetical protein
MSDFIDTVHQHFDPLANQYGLKCVTSSPKIVRFENGKVFLQVNFDAYRSYEIGVEIGEIPASAKTAERVFNLAEILRLRSSPDATYVERLQVSKPGILLDAICRLSRLVAQHATGLLSGDAGDFAQVANHRDKECAAYALARDLRYARSDAEKAWTSKNYVTVVNSYKPWEANLTPSEKKRLSFAEKKIANG